ncbi:MAG: hypothetical protein DRN37_04585 [Thermoplasmata archaeon]|nr:MAG: hypothetical protein DRN37_04585 [Thermoplasmata archaeon]
MAKQNRKLPATTFIIFLVCLSGAVFTSLYFLFSDAVVRAPTPVFEEIYSAPPGLREEIRRIDYAIYEALYLNGTPESDVSFLDVQPRRHGNDVWEFAELSVRCRDIGAARNLQKIIRDRLAPLGPAVVFRDREISDGQIACRILANNRFTHRIILDFSAPRSLPEDVRPKIAFIIDDLGYDPGMAHSFLELDLPISFSILPSATFTERIAQEAEKKGRDLILHLPMEPKHYPSVDPGPGALLLSMDEQEIRQTMDRDLQQVPWVKGVNNHMGSCFTEDREKMTVVLGELKKRSLFYIDSRTSRASVGYRLARQMGVPTARRNVFLDNDLAPRAIKIQLERLMSMARHSGRAIGIGHPHSETVRVIKEYLPRIKKEFRVVPAADLVS